ncbi:MAG TPA: hypothetical protein VJZ27_17885, partial [Aggregatilineales bacterium]|nr:hypothetical protein [Aggregatilineales bacterium]
ADRADLVVLTVPYSAQKGILESVKAHLGGKILVDVTVPANPSNIREVMIPEGRSAVEEGKALLGEDVRLVAAFQNVSASLLKNLKAIIECDVLICGDDKEAKEEVIKLAEAAGMRGVDAGPLVNAVAVEALTPILMYINKRYSIHGAGVRITQLA